MFYKKYTILFLLLLCCAGAIAGTKNLLFSTADSIARLDFSSVPVSISNNGTSTFGTAISHAEDPNGNLLFWANYLGIFDVHGTLMPGSNGINISMQATEINVVPFPDDPGKFYILYNEGNCSPLYYSVVDMSLRSGNGDVSQLNMLLDNGSYAEGMEVVSIPCTNDYWYLTFECNTGFKRFRIDTTGIGQPGIIYNFSPGLTYDGLGELEYHNFHLGMSFTQTDFFFIADFNPYSGVMMNPNPQIMPNSGSSPHVSPYGFEFSPDGSKAYISRHSSDNLYQYDIVNDDLYSLNIDNSLGQIEIGPDEKLYCSREVSNIIYVIENPNDLHPIISFRQVDYNLQLGISDPIQSEVVEDSTSSFYYGHSTNCMDFEVSFFPPPDPGCSNFYWDFGDGSTSTQALPVHQFAAAGTYQVLLISNCSCDTLVKSVTVPLTRISDFDHNTVCAGTPTGFSDLSTCTPQKWRWDFGDGSPVDTTQHPDHLYAGPGTYQVHLKTQWSDGHIDSVTKTVPVLADTGNAGFDYTLCKTPGGNVYADFTDRTYGEPIGWWWDFGNGDSDTIPDPMIQYDTLGTYEVTLAVFYDNGCPADTINKIIKYEPLLTSFKPDVGCPGEPVAFTPEYDSTIMSVDYWSWNFGDPNSSTDESEIENPSYTYDSTGSYVVSINFFFNGWLCLESFQDTILITDEIQGAFTFDNLCENQMAAFTDASEYLPEKWLWDFGDGLQDTVRDPEHLYSASGNYPVTLTVTNQCGFSDTVTHTIQVSPTPEAGFSADSGLCAGDNFLFTDESSPDVVGWHWDFGDGHSQSGQSVVHQFDDGGSYPAMLIVDNANGCTDTAYQTIVVIPAFDIRATRDTTVCPASEITLNALNGENLSWFTSGGQFIALGDQITIAPEYPEQYIVKANMGNCYREDTVDIDLHVLPTADAGPDREIYAGESVQLHASGGFYYQWTGEEAVSDPFIPNPFTSPQNTTTYTVWVYNEDSCYTRDDVTIIVLDYNNIAVPKAFTPNRDGKNEYFFPVIEGDIELVAFRIFNRWGQLIFETNVHGQGWDGTYLGKPQPIGTYVYYVITETAGEQEIVSQGSFSLLK